ncbi:MAG: endonuclease III domain-containing protein [Thermoleophilaceae bacterium]
MAVAAWRQPAPARLHTILERLAERYGHAHGLPHRAPVDELVLTVLSQNTNDRNRDVAYERLRDRFESWEEVRQAPEDEVIEAIRPGGLAPSKAPRIRSILDALDGDDLSRMEHEPLAHAREELCRLPGVGRKTAACVLLFAFGRHDVPVDTHVHRVGQRLGLFRSGVPLEEAHDEMLRLSAREDPFESHMALLRHGRRLCSARSPQCGICPLRRMCPYARGEL